MTTPKLPKGFRILSPAWLATNPLPEDAICHHKNWPIHRWDKSGMAGEIVHKAAIPANIYASATDLPAEAWAERAEIPTKCRDNCRDIQVGEMVTIWREADDLIIMHICGQDVRLSEELAQGLLSDLQSVCNTPSALAAQERAEKAEAEVEAVIADLPPQFRIRVHEGGSGVNLCASLAVSVARLTAEWSELLAESKALNAELEKAIQEAPHPTTCERFWGPQFKCTCWKSRISEQKPAQEQGEHPDKARLDWLECNHVEFAEELHRLGWKAPNDAQWEKLKLLLRRIRFAIDEACATPGAKQSEEGAQ